MRYLNHAGTSWPKPSAVHAAVREALIATPDKYAKLYKAAMDSIAGEFGPTVARDRLLLTSGCTAALGLALGDLPWQPGDTLVTSSLEHHALDRQAQALERNRGVRRVALAYRPGHPADLHELSETLHSGSVRVVALTAASNISGEQLPLQEVAALTKACNAWLLVDAAQTFGTDLFAESVAAADILVAAGHKAAMGPHGIGVLYARPEVHFESPTAVCEVGEAACGTFPTFCDVGSVNMAGASGLAAGLASTRNEREAIGQRTRAWAHELRLALQQRHDVRLLGPDPTSHPMLAERMAPIVSFVTTQRELSGVAEHFARHDVAIRVGTHCAPAALNALGAPHGAARVSFGQHNDEQDVQAVIAALNSL